MEQQNILGHNKLLHKIQNFLFYIILEIENQRTNL